MPHTTLSLSTFVSFETFTIVQRITLTFFQNDIFGLFLTPALNQEVTMQELLTPFLQLTGLSIEMCRLFPLKRM